MIDLFNFLKDLLRNETEVIAAFFMGIVVSAVFLTLVIYSLLSRHYGKKLVELETDAKNAKEELAGQRNRLKEAEQDKEAHKKKSKDRKARVDELEAEVDHLKESAGKAQLLARQFEEKHATASRQYHELAAKYNKLGTVAMSLKKQVVSLNDQAKLIERMQGQLWDLPVDKTKVTSFRPLRKNTAVIIAVTNLKGGVGKTTLTANLAATYCRQLSKRVLAVDLDIQASLTNLCLPADIVAGLQVGIGRLIDNVFADSASDVARLAFSNITQTRELKLHLLATSGGLANVEEQAKAKWIMNPGSADVRSILRSALHAPVFQDNFDVILIDCPPRWTTTSINAIACCDYVLIPTQLDRVSSEAVPRLLRWLRDLKTSSAELYGNFKVLGVVGNRAYNREEMILQEREIWKALPGKCEQAWLAPIHHFGTIIKDKSEFRRAANHREFAALHADLQPTFLKLVQEIEAGRAEHESR